MRPCPSPSSIEICQNPLPCRVHGTHLEDVSGGSDLRWLIEPVREGVLVTLLREGFPVGATRWCAYGDGRDGLARIQGFLLQEAGVTA